MNKWRRLVFGLLCVVVVLVPVVIVAVLVGIVDSSW